MQTLKGKGQMIRRLILLIALVLIVASAIAVLMPRLPVVQATSANASTGVHILYLRPNVPADVDIPQINSNWARYGITVVNDFQILKDLVSSKSIDTIMFHKSTSAQIDRVWLTQQYHIGKVIVGINMSMGELMPFVTGAAADKDWTDGWQREPFFSLISEVKRPNGGGHAQVTNLLYSIDYLMLNIDSALGLRN